MRLFSFLVNVKLTEMSYRCQWQFYLSPRFVKRLEQQGHFERSQENFRDKFKTEKSTDRSKIYFMSATLLKMFPIFKIWRNYFRNDDNKRAVSSGA